MALCSNARRFAVDLARVWRVVEKQRVKDRDGWVGSLGGMAVVSFLCCALSLKRLALELGQMEAFLWSTPLTTGSRTFLQRTE